MNLRWVFFGVFLACGAAAHAHAQAPDAGPEPEPEPAADSGSGLEPPELLSPSEAEYPEAARAAGLEASVVLKLEIDAAGHVTHAEVLEPAGPGFDEAAVAAAFRFEFTPARRGGVAMASRIRYRYEFHLPPLAAEPPPPPPPPPPPQAAVRQAPEAPIQVNVHGFTAADRQRRSAEAVSVIDTQEAQRRSADMGDVLAATQGVNVRRDGGLGSATRFSLNGLSGDQVRLFLDGLPLELIGYPFGIANVPVNLIDRVEIYSGVVPIRFGADALGGAVNMVTDQNVYESGGSVSYQAGSFDTHRLSLSAQSLDKPSGTFARFSGFFDYTRNDYPVEVDVADDKGQMSKARIYRFHDAYNAEGGNIEVGVVERPWAERLLLRAFVTSYYKQYQNNVVMTVPYGGVAYTETTPGVSLQYKQPLAQGVDLDLVGGYTYASAHFRDEATCYYDWFGRCIRTRTTPGETDTKPHDQLFWDHTGFARFNFSWQLAPQHTLRLALAPTYLTRSGDERLQNALAARDALSAERKLFTLVNGIEYQLDLFGDRLENVLFFKQYFQTLNSEAVGTGNVFHPFDRHSMRFGAGENLRVRATDWLWFKASYEFATRLPDPLEVFGDNAFISANLELKPEISHNGNAGFNLDLRDTPAGGFRATANAFVRKAEQLIVLLGTEKRQSYQNVYNATSLGVEGALGWTSPHDYLVLDANATYQDFRNRSHDGAFAKASGDRVPSQPYFFSNTSARLQFRDVIMPRDRLSLFGTTRYVHSFYRGWESLGDPSYKQTVPAQFVVSAGFGYLIRGESGATFSTSVEMQNLADTPVYDYFGVQRPGRALYVKTAAEF